MQIAVTALTTVVQNADEFRPTASGAKYLPPSGNRTKYQRIYPVTSPPEETGYLLARNIHDG